MVKILEGPYKGHTGVVMQTFTGADESARVILLVDDGTNIILGAAQVEVIR